MPLYLHGNEPRIERVKEMSNQLPIAFASNDADEIKKVLRVMGLRINLNRLQKPSESQNFETVIDGISVKGVLSFLQNDDIPAFHIGFTESDIGELIGEYISDKAGVPVLDTTKIKDNEKINSIFSHAIHGVAVKGRTRQKRTSPTQKKLDTVLQAMPNDTFVQSLDQQYKRKGRLTPKQQSALQKIHDRVTNPTPLDPQLVARLDALVKVMPRDRFVKSLRDQYHQRGSLSTKQMSALEKLEKGVASGGDKALIQRIDALLSNTVKIKGRRKTLLKSFKEQALNGRRLSQRQLELISEYEDLVR